MSEFDDIFAEFEKEFKKVEKKEETSQEIPVSEEGEQIVETEESVPVNAGAATNVDFIDLPWIDLLTI